MSINKQKFEQTVFVLILLFIVVNAIWQNDSYCALISALCGITYTVFAGKGRPFCYIFGVCGSAFYAFLSFQNALWGNLILYLCYYVPMQILGYFKWNKNLKFNRYEIIKLKTPVKEMAVVVSVSIILTLILCGILIYMNDTHPILDSITTVFSLGGMYFTVRRAIEQWMFWTIVNALSFLMWLYVALMGAGVYSTAAMWFIYLFLGIYFYFEWKKELKIQ